VKEARVLALALHAVVAPAERVREVVRQVLVELLVFLVSDLRARANPQGLSGVHRAGFSIRGPGPGEKDRHTDVVGVLANERLEPRLLQELLLGFPEVERHPRPARLPLDPAYRALAFPARFPVHPVTGPQPGAPALALDPAGADAGRVDAATEPARQ